MVSNTDNFLDFSGNNSYELDTIFIPIPDGYHCGKDGEANDQWLYIVPEDYPLSANHIDATPFSFGIAHNVLSVQEFDESMLNRMEALLKLQGALRFDLNTHRCTVNSDCTFMYQFGYVEDDLTFSMIKGFMLTNVGMYQFHIYYNHGAEKNPTDDSTLNEFKKIAESWMSKTVTTKAPIYQMFPDMKVQRIGDKRVMLIPGDSPNRLDENNSVSNDHTRPASRTESKVKYVELTLDDVETLGDELLAYRGSEVNVIFPDGITEIGDDFESSVGFENIVIPEGVTRIGERAFVSQYNLKSVSLPSTLEVIAKEAFDGCLLLEKVDFPEGLTTIEDDAFSSCDSLTKIVIPRSVKTLANSPFYECHHIKDVFVLGAIEDLDDSAFFGLSDDAVLHIPRNEEFKRYCESEYLKYDHKSLSSYTTPALKRAMERSSESDFVVKNGVLTAYNGYARVVEIPNSVQEIAPFVFAHHHEIERVIISEGVTVLGGGAFKFCISLNEIIFPTSLRKVDGVAFYQCMSLKRVSFAPGLETLEGSLFHSNTKDVYLPSTLMNIEESAVYAVSGVTLHVPKGSVAEDYAKQQDIPFDNECDPEMQKYVEEAECRAREEAERRAREEAERKAREEEERKAREEAMRKLEQAKAETTQRRLDYITNAKSALQNNLSNTIAKLTAELEAKNNEIETAIANKTMEKHALEQKLASASFFALGLKKQLKVEIEATESNLEKLAKEMSELNVKYQEKVEIEKDKTLREIDKLPQKATLRYPMPK